MKKGLLVLAACLTASSAWASPADPFVQPSAELKLDGIDFATVEGQNRLAIRMDNAARAVCGDRLASVHLDAARSARECRATVVADIRTQIEQRMAAKDGATRLASSR